jgi:hypothetical protein
LLPTKKNENSHKLSSIIYFVPGKLNFSYNTLIYKDDKTSGVMLGELQILSFLNRKKVLKILNLQNEIKNINEILKFKFSK